MKKILSAIFMVLICQSQAVEGWKDFYSPEGNCRIAFPVSPQHIKERMKLPNSSSFVEYDVYIAPLQKKAIFVMMIADYPKKIREDQVNTALESFLSGMINNSDNNRLIFADLTELKGQKALEFFVESNKDYFRGKTFLSNNKLFLIAVECLDEKDSESLFYQFSDSFEFDAG